MKRRALTLVELLVVLAILGTLVALLLPAVQRARAALDQMRCLANLRTLGRALGDYQAEKGFFPPGCSYSGPNEPFPHMGWQTRLLPYLEHADLWQEAVAAFAQQKFFLHQPPHRGLGLQLKEFICPSDPRLGGAVELPSYLGGTVLLGFTSYLGVLGVDQTRNDGVLFLNSRIRPGDIRDGLSNTLLVGERPPSARLNAGWWYAGWGMNKNGAGDMILGVAEFNLYDTSYSPGKYGCADGPYAFQRGQLNNQCSMFHFWSLHPGGANFLFADGHARLVRYTAAPVMPALATRAGKEPAPALD
jgi:prepilin-type processing-associated H-X9-DG protein/prepilin-type N-terminal cleavage/methylation domain-containing protein